MTSFRCKCDTYWPKDRSKCPKCGETKEVSGRREWQEQQEEQRKEHQNNPLLYYCYKILGNTPDYEISFEEHEKDQEENRKFRNGQADKVEQEGLAEYYIIGTGKHKRVNPLAEALTPEEWYKKVRKNQKQKREKLKLEEADRKLERNSPIYLLSNMFREINSECECEAAKMRTGKFCKICVLATKLRQYALDLFKDAAEGRSSYI